MVFGTPAVIVHDLPQMQAVLAVGRPVLLCSAPAAGLYMGAGWWAEMLAACGVTGLSLLDCADAPGRALEALEEGLPGLILDCADLAFAVVAQIAAAQNAILLRTAPPALDMAAARELPNWLASGLKTTPTI
jgi:hypothetical protein